MNTTEDPWYFTPDTDMDFTVTVIVSDADLEATTDPSTPATAHATINASASFGSGGEAGSNVLATATWTQDLFQNDTFSFPGPITLINQTFHLVAGQTYWLSAEVDTAAQATPGSPIQGNAYPINTTEGSSYSGTVANFSDPIAAPGTRYTATIDWGDGNQSTASTDDGSIAPDGSGGWNITGTHTYADEGSYPVYVIVARADDPSTAVTFGSTATVAEGGSLSVTLDITSFQATAGTSWSGTVLSFTDSVPEPDFDPGDYAAVFVWNDGSQPPSSSGTVVSNGDGSYDVQVSHTFPSSGTYTVFYGVSDEGFPGPTGMIGASVAPPSSGGGMPPGGADVALPATEPSTPSTSPDQGAPLLPLPPTTPPPATLPGRRRARSAEIHRPLRLAACWRPGPPFRPSLPTRW